MTAITEIESVPTIKAGRTFAESIVATVRDPLLILDSELRVVSASRSFYERFKATPNQTEGRRVYELGNGQWDVPALRRLLEEILAEKNSVDDFKIDHDFKHLGRRIMVLNARRFPPDTEHTQLILLAIEDVTDRFLTQRAAAAIQKKAILDRERLLVTLRSIGDGVITTDIYGRVCMLNPVAETLTGWGSKEAIGRPLTEVFNIISEETREPSKSPHTKVMESGRIVGLANHTLLVRKDGTEVAISDSGAPVLDPEGDIIGIILVFRDVTRERRIEAQLRQAQKMEAIGTLAGGIAHDFNNILSSIIGFTELALDDVEKGGEIESNLHEVYTAGLRAKDLTAQILLFARNSKNKLGQIRIDNICKEVLKLIRSTIPTTIEVKGNITSKSLIMGNITQIHQVLMNLCTNAASAMEDEGGTLEVSLDDVKIDGASEGLNPGDYIKLTVSDTGTGIQADKIESIFDPYYTSKGVGEGSGLGLAVVHGIVDSYNGTIIVDSEWEKGSVFSVYLPVCIQSGQAVRPIEPEEIPTGRESVLIVDDEAAVAKMHGLILESLGYSVTTRTSSVEALSLFRAKPQAFDLVITDMTMPGMTGDLFAASLMAIRPDIPVIVCTGYSKKISEKEAMQTGIKALAVKPIVKADLAKIVRQVLDQAPTKP